LNLANNVFTGAIPEEIGGAVELKELQLNQNQLISTIPDSIGEMTNLGK
jgi:hypothetical protein